MPPGWLLWESAVWEEKDYALLIPVVRELSWPSHSSELTVARESSLGYELGRLVGE